MYVHLPVQEHKKCYTYKSKFHLICQPILKKKNIWSKNEQLDKTTLFSQLASCSPCRWSVMVFRRSVLSCGLKNKTSPISIRRKGAVCKPSVLLSGLRRRNSSRHTRKRRATCKLSVQHCALRKRHCCRNRSSWRKTLPGQCTKLHYQELSFTPTFVLPLTRLTLLHSIPHTSLCLILHLLNPVLFCFW